MSKLVQQWFYLARKDLMNAEFNWNHQKDKESCKELVAFLAQQTAEKSIKGLLQFHKIRFEKTHDLARLVLPLLKIHPELESLFEQVQDLTEYAVAFRYPDAQAQALTEKQVHDAIMLAKKINQEMMVRIF